MRRCDRKQIEPWRRLAEPVGEDLELVRRLAMRRGIAAAGNWIVDRVKIVDHWPEQDTLANILDEQVGNGGGAFNVLMDLAQLGAKFPLDGVGLVGKDLDSSWILQKCQDRGIGTSQIRQVNTPTSYTDVMTVRGTGRRTFFHHRGANALLSEANIQIEKLTSKIFYLGYLLLLDELDREDGEYGTRAARLLATASSSGMKTAIDVVSEDSDRFTKVVVPALPHVDWCFMNEFEAWKTTGYKDLERAGIELLKLGVHECAFLHGPEGAWAVSGDGDKLWQPSVALPQEEIGGCVGAGDAFAAGVLYGLHEEARLKKCLEIGVCVAAASLKKADASEGISKLDDCLKLGAKFGFKKG